VLPDSVSAGQIADIAANARTITELRQVAANCRACDLWRRATQTVFGEGARRSEIMLVGEQPGDQEDLAGHPFVGPAGKILNEALTEAGIDRKQVYVTNVVKHFKWEPAGRGKRRIHQKPRYSEMSACRPWLDAELRIVKPQILVCLGATAAGALLGKNLKVSSQHGQLIPSPLASYATATVHPSFILRAPDEKSRHSQMQSFISDWKKIAALMAQKKAAQEFYGE
jgi:uracil-DNA glycosylase family protein